jgi:5'-nucleotidase
MSPRERAVQHWQQAALAAARHIPGRKHYRDHLSVSAREHMSPVDCFDGAKVRTLAHKGRVEMTERETDDKDVEFVDNDDLLVVHPMVDGRLKDEGRP